ncbi:hypothetical protein LY76DRAFT_683878 [Colletotrichum caudatum]|nr:hypothetical protein LY76DRAFT_683878 [Colletotrichum caudatum]
MEGWRDGPMDNPSRTETHTESPDRASWSSRREAQEVERHSGFIDWFLLINTRGEGGSCLASPSSFCQGGNVPRHSRRGARMARRTSSAAGIGCVSPAGDRLRRRWNVAAGGHCSQERGDCRLLDQHVRPQQSGRGDTVYISPRRWTTASPVILQLKKKEDKSFSFGKRSLQR